MWINKEYIKSVFYLGLLFLLTACTERVEIAKQLTEQPAIIPDYVGVTIPEGIAPLNFTFDGSFDKINAVLEGSSTGRINVQGREDIQIPLSEWKQLLSENKGGEIRITVALKQEGQWIQYAPFSIYVSEYPIDYGLVYRLVAPGYEIYSKMGIYQRTLADFTQKAIIENTLVAGSCVNCHSFRKTKPDEMSLHVRGEYGGTILQTDGNTDILDLKTTEALGRGVYPYWHPSGKYIAYSINDTRQMYHSSAEKRIEVVDRSSDLTVYSVEQNKVLTTPLLMTDAFETFPAFSADGKSLFFCVSEQKTFPAEYKEVRYNLCRINFDPETGAFGNEIDTLLNVADIGKSISFPRPSYDGRFLMYTLSDYGNFSIWHKEADLWLLDLQTGETRPLDEVNSPDTESYHSWSSNSRWFVFSSRRGDGLYTRLYIASLDEEGKATKPFLLPQQQAHLYDPLLYSYNIPEFVSGEVSLDIPKVEEQLLSKQRKTPE